MDKGKLLHTTVGHLDIKAVNVVPLIEMMSRTAFQARNTGSTLKEANSWGKVAWPRSRWFLVRQR